MSDLQAASRCSGYYAGNLNGGNADKIADSKYALVAIGFNWDGVTIVQKIESFSGQAIEFALPLVGTSFVSIHYGGGQSAPTRGGGGSTGFYRIDSLTPLASFATRFGSLSNAILYSNTPPPGGGGGGLGGGGGGIDPAPIPEPALWLQLIAGFGLIGWAARRHQRGVAA